MPYELESSWCCFNCSQAMNPAVTAASTPAALKRRFGQRTKAMAAAAPRIWNSAMAYSQRSDRFSEEVRPTYQGNGGGGAQDLE